MTQMSQQSSSITSNQEELILVVKREYLLPSPYEWQGLRTDGIDEFVQRITQYQEFIPRSMAEEDETYKQIIPYIIFRFRDRYFLMQRKAGASEQRLKGKYLLGIGGHLRQEDMRSSSIIDWALREFHEEVSYAGSLQTKVLGMLNDDSSAVGRVHLGLVLLFDGDSGDIAVKSELEQGFLATVDDCNRYVPQMEAWSVIIMNYLPRGR